MPDTWLAAARGKRGSFALVSLAIITRVSLSAELPAVPAPARQLTGRRHD